MRGVDGNEFTHHCDKLLSINNYVLFIAVPQMAMFDVTLKSMSLKWDNTWSCTEYSSGLGSASIVFYGIVSFIMHFLQIGGVLKHLSTWEIYYIV